MNLQHASAELHTTGNAVVAKTVYTAAGRDAGLALGLGLDTTWHAEAEAALNGLNGLSGASDTSG